MMAGNPLISTTPPPPTVLMRDGQWLVDPEQRPKGWERMGVREPEGAGPKPNALKELSSEPVTEGAIKKQAPNQISDEKKALLKGAFDNGASIREAAATAGVAKQTAAKFKTENAIEQAPCGCGQAAGHQGWCSFRYQRSTKRQAVVERFHSVETVTEETIETATVEQELVAAPEPEPLAKPKVERRSYLPNDPPIAAEFYETALKYWGEGHRQITDEEADTICCETLPKLAEEIDIHREAKRRTEEILCGWMDARDLWWTITDLGEDGFEKEWRALWECVHAGIVQTIRDAKEPR
jgi:hypothetical protein